MPLEFDIDSSYGDLLCDECPATEGLFAVENLVQAVKSANMSGWRRRKGPDGEVWLCPNCASMTADAASAAGEEGLAELLEDDDENP